MSIERLIMKNKKKTIIDIKLTEEDIKISLLELKRKVGSPRLNFGIK